MREPEVKSLDPTLCISVSARENFEQQMDPVDKIQPTAELVGI